MRLIAGRLGVYLSGEALAKLSPFVAAIYIAIFLGPSQFGVFSLLTITWQAVYIFTSFNVQATTRIDYFKLGPRAFVARKFAHLLLALSLSLVWMVLGAVQSFISYEYVVALAACGVLKAFSDMQLAVFQCARRAGSYALVQVVFSVLLAGGACVSVSVRGSAFDWVWALAFACVIQFMLCVYLSRLRLAFRLLHRLSFNLAEILAALAHGAMFMPQAIGWWLKVAAERAVIAGSIGLAAVGVYSFAYQLASPLVLGVAAVNLALVPEINRHFKEADRASLNRVLKFGSLLVVSGAVATLLLGEGVLNARQFTEYSASKELFPLVLLAMVPQAFMLLFINVHYISDNGLFVAKTIIAGYTIHAVLAYLLVPIYGVPAVIGSTLFINTIMLGLVYFRSRIIINSL